MQNLLEHGAPQAPLGLASWGRGCPGSGGHSHRDSWDRSRVGMVATRTRHAAPVEPWDVVSSLHKGQFRQVSLPRPWASFFFSLAFKMTIASLSSWAEMHILIISLIYTME